MVFITAEEILETVRMIRSENLDVRAVTMGISLDDCAAARPAPHGRAHPRQDRAPRRPPGGGRRRAAGEVRHPDRQPARLGHAHRPAWSAATTRPPTSRSRTRSTRPPSEVGIDFVGGFSALVQKGFTRGDAALIEAIPEAISSTQRVCSSVNVASTRAGINMDAVVRMADVLLGGLASARRTDDCIGCAKIVVFCNVPEDNPFMAGAMHGSGEPEVQHQRRHLRPRRGAQRRRRTTPTPRSSSSPTSSSARRSRSRASASSSPGGLADARRRRWASSTSRWRPRRRWATPSPRSSRAWAWSRSAPPAPPRRWRCSTTPSRRAAPWPRRPPAASPAPSSP